MQKENHPDKIIEVDVEEEGEDNLSKFVQKLRTQMNSIPVHAPKPSGRVGFESGDFAEPRNGVI